MYNILILSDNVLISLENEFSLLLLHSIFYAISLRGGSCFLFFFLLVFAFWCICRCFGTSLLGSINYTLACLEKKKEKEKTKK